MKQFLLLVGVCALIGCSTSTGDVSDSDIDAITIKKPDVTAAESRANLEKTNLSPEVKRVLGGGTKGK